MRSSLQVLATGAELDAIARRVGAAISASNPDGVVLVGVLKGSLCFLADVARHVTVPVRMDFLAVSPYAAGSGRVRLLKDLDEDVHDRAVVLVEDIVDTGLTANYLRAEIGGRGPSSLQLAALVDRPARRIVPVSIDHTGLVVPDVFVLGYGLDFAGRYRNLHGLWGADAAALAAEPDGHLLDLYPG